MSAPHDPEPSAARVACLLVPDLLLAAELRAHPERAGRPLAIASGPEARAEIVAVSPEAERAGVRRLCSVVQARAVCATLEVRAASPTLEQAARSTLRDVALSASPRVEPAPRGSGLHAAEAAIYLDARGISRLFRTEHGFAGALVGRAAKLGLPAVAAVAASRGVAHLAARDLARRGQPDVAVVAAGTDAAFLAPLPLDLLAPPDALADALARLGIRRVGELARLSARALHTRLGPAAGELQQLARGTPQEPPIAPVRDTSLEEALDLEFPVERLEPLGFALRGLLGRLVARLDLRGLACGELALTLGLLGGGHEDRRLELAAPTLDERVLLRRTLLALETRPPEAPVERVALAARGHLPRRDQLDLFRPAGPAPAQLEQLLAELEALCGAGQVGAPRVLDDLRPDACGLSPFRPLGPLPPPDATEERPAVRALRPPLPAQVHARAGRPLWIRSALANGRVIRAAGPWRTSGSWWSPERRFAYDHFDVETEDGLVTRLRCDLLHARWEIDAVYD